MVHIKHTISLWLILASSFGSDCLCRAFVPRRGDLVLKSYSVHSPQLNFQRSALSVLPVTELEKIKRVYCISDLHTDHIDNLKWLRNQVSGSSLKETDLVVVAGDISHEYNRLTETLQVLRQRCQVFFIAGNHEAWLTKEDPRSSMKKLQLVEAVCEKIGVHTKPIYVNGNYPLWIAPTHSWYDGTLSFDEILSKGFNEWPWVDFVRCEWSPDRFPAFPKSSGRGRIPQGLVEHFLELNEPFLQYLQEQISAGEAVLTVSHFLPNKQCLPDWCDLKSSSFDAGGWLDHGAGGMSAKFAKVAGSKLIDNQLRSLKLPGATKHLHLFGHSHRPKDFTFDGLRYIHNPLGKPRERALHMISPNVNFQLLWNTKTGEVAGKPVICYWEEEGGGVEKLRERLEKNRQKVSSRQYKDGI
ncbi:predicted protein [Phaeodactylum tricornutum CCAP 1055/1]|uniref:Calcineurin-like phosphoesterase domain-containing protein n=1 Tax=Phaeodactylum tricornutum (strain CCAP 1055/1) TaxID=556484 RepID=B7G3C8_PHATC|nr:predicted protein [Phaeodactylum tricornutum CCAP 1055/1]EEC46809.1 predicted protein [Phaeodactylum tricornutum CCAP 1055/1]|eukprot:XP_002181595.1 predicted protein [Phaeodactylum tricornutum CCAP 1055/1]